MDWNRVRQVNRKASARKAKRERLAAEAQARVVALGGEFTIDELRAADVRVVELPRQYVGITDPHVIWALRGGEWLVYHDFGNEPCGMMRVSDRHNSRATIVPFVSAVAKRYASGRAKEMYEAKQAEDE